MITGSAEPGAEEGADDRLLIQRVLAGEVDAFEGVLRKHSPRILSLVGRKVPAGDVEAVAQEVFLSAFRSLGSYEATQPLEHWLARIVRRRCCDYWRERERQGRVESVCLDAPDHAGLGLEVSGGSFRQASGEAGRQDAAEALHRALGRLNAEDRALMEAVYFEEVPLKEMAVTLGWSLVKTKVRAHRARNALRTILESHFRSGVKR